MPSPTARTLRASHIINAHYRQDLHAVFETTRCLTSTKPDQANNEIRNGLNHLARALAEQKPDDASLQFRKAEDHFDRAKRDCLKISLVQLHDDLWREITDIEIVDGHIDSNLRKRVRRWEDGRLSIARAECRGELEISARLLRLVNDGIDLKRELRDRHRKHPFWKVWLSRRRPWVRAIIKEASTVVIFAVIAGAGIHVLGKLNATPHANVPVPEQVAPPPTPAPAQSVTTEQH